MTVSKLYFINNFDRDYSLPSVYECAFVLRNVIILIESQEMLESISNRKILTLKINSPAFW